MKPKLESLDAVRAIACLFVVSFHAYLTLFGYSGLSMFFVLSPPLIVCSVEGSG